MKHAVDTVTLERIRRVAIMMFTEADLHNLTVDFRRDHIVNTYLLETVHSLLAYEAKAVKHEITYPADWWQHLKQRWFPAWAQKRWPVKEAVCGVRVRVLAAFPHGRIAFESFRVDLPMMCEVPPWAPDRTEDVEQPEWSKGERSKERLGDAQIDLTKEGPS